MRMWPSALHSHQPAIGEVYWTQAREDLSAGESCPGNFVGAGPFFFRAISRASATTKYERIRFISGDSVDSSRIII